MIFCVLLKPTTQAAIEVGGNEVGILTGAFGDMPCLAQRKRIGTVRARDAGDLASMDFILHFLKTIE